VALLQARRGSRLNLKKTLYASEQDRTDIARRRTRWKAHQGWIDPKRLVFIDEATTTSGIPPTSLSTPERLARSVLTNFV
jgi:hypothetical protein